VDGGKPKKIAKPCASRAKKVEEEVAKEEFQQAADENDILAGDGLDIDEA
jgi:hypothetical protein